MPVVPRPFASYLVALAAVVVALAAWWWLPSPAAPGGGEGDGPDGTVVRVVDGDTVVVDLEGDDETVRLIGVDTPESVARDRPNECFGTEASARLAELLPPGTAVRLTRDVEPRDVYDRLLAYVVRSSDGLFVNAALVTDGYAEARDYPPNTVYRDDFEAGERAARHAGQGLWSACGGPDVPLAALPP